MEQYLNLGKELIAKYDRLGGRIRRDRTGVGTVSVFGRQIRFNLQEGFPLVTTKKVFMRGLTEENLWFLRGSTNNNELTDLNVHIWDEWALKDRRAIRLDTFDRMKERLDLWHKKLKAEGYSGYVFAPSNARIEDFEAEIQNGRKILITDKSIDEIMDAEGIPRTVEEKGPADGDLGPIYGKQWRFWKNSREVQRFTIAERHALAVQAQRLGEANFTDDQLMHLERCYGLVGDRDKVEEERLSPQMQKFVHDVFDNWGIPKGNEEPAFFDQIETLIKGLRTKPYSRRHIVSAWNVSDLPDESLSPQENVKQGRMALAPCHTLFQFYVEDMELGERVALAEKKMGAKFSPQPDYNDEHSIAGHDRYCDALDIPKHKLSCLLYQRSADFCLGVPFNIASYALLTMMIAQVVGMVPGEFIHTFGDLHIYSNHIEKFRNEQMNREPRPLPKMTLNPEVTRLEDFKISDFVLTEYDPHPKIEYGGVAV